MAGQTDLALILRGVGSLAAYEAGAIASLYDGRYTARTISAKGMGAVNAAIIAGNEDAYVSTRLSAFWLALAGWNIRDLNFLYDIVSQYVDFDRINSGPVHLRITLCEVKHGKDIIFDNSRTAISLPHVIASALPPPMMTMINGMAFWGSEFSEISSISSIGERDNARLGERLPIVEIIPDIETTTDAALPQTLEEAAERYREVLLANSLDSASSAAIREPGAGRLCRIMIGHKSMSGMYVFDHATVDARYRKGYTTTHNFELEHWLPPPALLPGNAWLGYATLLSLGEEFSDFQFIFVPNAVTENSNTEVVEDSVTLVELVDMVSQLLSNVRNPLAGSSLQIEQVAAAIVYEVQIPVTNSPLQGWTIAGLVTAFGALHSGTMGLDSSQGPMIILETAGSLLLLGPAAVVSSWFRGLCKAAETHGLRFGTEVVFRNQTIPPSKRSNTSLTPRQIKSESDAPKAHVLEKKPTKATRRKE